MTENVAGGWKRAWSAAGDASQRFGRAARRTGRAALRAGRSAAEGARKAGLAAAGGTRRVGRAARRLTHAGEAGRTGLGRLIELSAAHSAGDAMVAIALADTFLFGLPVDEARGYVAVYLLITMAPFAILAPFVGPVLDRFRSGRRYVMAGTLLARGLLCWALAAAVVAQDAVTLFPAALAVLVLSKAYNVSRAAIMPSVLPANTTLVTANARVALFTLVSAGLVVPIAAGLTALIGAEWVLRGTMVLFLVAGVNTVRLPRHVDAPDPEDEEEGRRKHRWRTLFNVGPAVGEAVRANAAVRLFSGYLLFFLLFLVQEGHLPGMPTTATLSLLAAAAGAGGLIGAAVASWVRARSPQITVLITLAVVAATGVVTAFLFGLWAALAVALVAALAQELGKLALDAIVQREIGEEVRSSTFGVVEALLQIAWVAGGLAGLVMSLLVSASTGLWIIGGACAAVLVLLLVARKRRPRAHGDAVRAETARREHRPSPDPGPAEAPAADGDTITEVLPRPPSDRPDGPGHTKPLTNPYG
ncbi:Predicted arabinose efflux permease, MFS family [Thermostaphylospora chromogena]|uniref:Predicted arabinose efflux permease, MFS family n=1 Tax=Thermostaphylospora chromogena TaxID=35622 RepID=A0A1H1BMN7_9ACTN|nr:Predicted arabinose efflux permease, MFS family [Thermostaphylospora chromogena]